MVRSLDAEGHLLQQTTGNSIITQHTCNAANGRITGIVAGAGNAVQILSYTYDSIARCEVFFAPTFPALGLTRYALKTFQPGPEVSPRIMKADGKD